ncbi:MAG TPA: RES family NAD+ phosphorylase [Casimicrobiaceae bacterium]|nr:RES family NAD+ phosphorylase [Casimicrobiaceae bacterium]
MRVFRASRRPRRLFDPLDARPSVARDGWRFNDRSTAILYAAEVEALAILEVVARPGWETVEELSVATIEIPDGAVVGLADLGLSLPANWNQRPAARDAQRIGGEFLAHIDARGAQGPILCGVRMPSVISSTDHNVLLDPRQKARYSVAAWSRISFDWLRSTAT